MKKHLELDLIISAPSGVTEEMRDKLQDALIAAAEGIGAEVGGSWHLENEEPEEKKIVHHNARSRLGMADRK